MNRPMTRHQAKDDRGTATVFVLGLIVVLFGFAGLVIDGGNALNTRARMADLAEQAARAGADQLDIGSLRSNGAVTINCGPAVSGAVDGYLASYPADHGIVTGCTAQTVTVTVHTTVNTEILQILPGLDHFGITASATARAEAL